MEEGYTPAVWMKDEGGRMEAFEDDDEEEDDLSDIKKKLFDALETPMKRESFLGNKKQPVVVYLRVRPKSQLEILNQDADCLHQMSENELLAVAPPSSQTFKNKNGARSVAEGNQKFLFTNIFSPEASQKEVFEETLMPTLKDFFEGQNCLVFTYGVTNSGKTYTVTGTSTEPGILPRSLDVIFNSIDQKQFSSIAIKPKHFSSVEYLDSREQEREEALKEEIIGKARELGSQLSPTAPPVDETDLMSDPDMSTVSKASSNYSKVTEEGLSFEVHDDSSVELEGGDHNKFSVWVSFAEIYNEFIYDLLTEVPAKGKQRPALKLAEDKNRNHFIKGLRELQVDNVEEAMLLLRLGLQHRHVAATRLNYQSSRSHSIYTIKLIKVVDMERPQHAIVNRISIVDLAGAERSGKTGATGIRVREAGNINNSLLTLGKCIDAMKYNQNRKGGEERVVPFRESKLTRLFQNYFVGKGKGVRQGKITMFVNVSNSSSVFDENIHVLKFSALASKVVPLVTALPGRNPARTHPPPLLSDTVLPQMTEETESRKSVAWETEEEEEEVKSEGEGGTLKVARVVPVFTVPCGHCKEQLTRCQEEARAKISELQVQLIEQEYLIRQEVCREFGEQLIEIDERHSQELEEQAADLGELYEKRYQLLHKSMKKQLSRKRRRPDDDVDDRSVEQSLRAEVSCLKGRVEELEEELAMEKTRAAAELCDTAESHETRTVLLNQQLADMAMKLSATQSECQSLRERLDSGMKHVAELSNEKEEWESLRKSALAQREENEQLRAEAETFRNTIASLTSQTKVLERDKMAVLTCHKGEVQMLETQRADAVTEAELLQQRISELTAEKREVEERVEEVMREKRELEERVEEVMREKREVEERVEEVMREKRKAEMDSEEDLDKDATLSHLCSEVTQLSSQLEACQSELSLLKCTHAQEMTALQENHEEEMRRVRETHVGERMTLQEKMNVIGAELAVKQEAIYKLEAEIEATSKESVCCDYETMLKNQSSRLSELDAEREELHAHNTELEARVRDLEMRLGKVTSARDRLNERVEELTATLQESRKALSQREAELLGSSEQCRVVLEEQIADLRKQLSTTEQDLCVSKEDLRSLHQQLREKDSELLLLTKSSSGDQTRVQSLSTELEETKQRAEQSSQEHLAQLEALQGHHQLEMAQLTIRVRELSEQLEGQMASTSATHEQEVESLQAQWRTEVASLNKDLKQAEKKLVKMKAVEAENKNLKKDINKMKEDFECTRSLLDAQILSLESDLKEREEELSSVKATREEMQTVRDEWLKEAVHHQDMRVTVEEHEEHIYEEPPELPEDTTVYETITDVSTSTWNPPHSSSVLQAIENTADRSVHQSIMISDLDRSKPYVPVLDSSSQLMEDSFIVGEKRTEIHVTPLAKKKRVGKTRKRKRDTEMEKVDTKNSPAKKSKYPLRNRLKSQHSITEDVENTPLMKAPSLKKFTRILSSGTKTPVTPSEGQSSPVNLTPPRTRRKKPIRKSQISGPLELLESPHQQSRQPLEVKTKFSLGRQLRPLRTIK